MSIASSAPADILSHMELARALQTHRSNTTFRALFERPQKAVLSGGIKIEA